MQCLFMDNLSIDRMYKRKSHVNCCVKQCKNTVRNTSGDIKFYNFPKASYKAEQRRLWVAWVNKVNLNGWEETKNSKLCSAHFIGNKSSPTRTSPAYVPTIINKTNNTVLPKEKATIERFKRHMKRRIGARFLISPANRNEIEHNVHNNVEENVLTPEVPVQTKTDVGVQVCFLDDFYNSPFGNDAKLFLCNQFYEKDSTHSQVQVYIPEGQGSLRIVKDRKTNDKCCGNSPSTKDQFTEMDLPGSSQNNALCLTGFHGFQSINGNQDILDLCGVTLSTFDLLLRNVATKRIMKVQHKDRLMIFLMKLKTGLTFSALAVLFRISRTTVSRTFFSVLQSLRVACNDFIFWPCLDVVLRTMPDAFKESYPNCRVIIDCTEIRVEQPNSIEQRIHLYSHYKKGYTVKVLVGCTPGGAISFISKCFGGRTTDCQITVASGLLHLLEPGDTVLADKGFPGVQTVLDEAQNAAIVVMPPFLHDHSFSREEVDLTYKIAKVRIHIERIMQRLRVYKILDKFSQQLLPHADDIVYMCRVLVNLQPPIIQNGDAVHDDASSNTTHGAHESQEHDVT